MRAAIYARVSTLDQEPENQLTEVRHYVEARTWMSAEYIDRGVSGAKDRRPALDEMVRDARRRRFDVVVCWRLDRLGRNLKHLVTLLEELQALGIAFVSLNEGIDATTPAGKLQMHILGAIAEFKRARIAERVKAGLQRAKAQGRRLGRLARPRRRSWFPAAPYGRRRGPGGCRSRRAARWIVAGRRSGDPTACVPRQH
jgi:DNA invertase Pin-like site-specific DNA recombinase